MTTIDEIKARLAASSIPEWEARDFRRDVAFLLAEVDRLRAVLPTTRESDDLRACVDAARMYCAGYTIKDGSVMAHAHAGDHEPSVRRAEATITRLDAYRTHEAAARFRARAGDEPGGAMVSDGTKEGGEHE